jgi:hypothetical protein
MLLKIKCKQSSAFRFFLTRLKAFKKKNPGASCQDFYVVKTNDQISFSQNAVSKLVRLHLSTERNKRRFLSLKHLTASYQAHPTRLSGL